MNTQAALNLRTVKNAYRAFCAKDPDKGTALTQIRVDVLASALHFLEVGACATQLAYDPTVPQHAQLKELASELAERSGMASRFSLNPLAVSGPQSLQDCCREAIAEATPLLLRLTASRIEVASDKFHEPLGVEERAATVAGWRACFTSPDFEHTREELAAKVFWDEPTFYGSKCVVGVLGNPELTKQMKDLIIGADEPFLQDHLIPAMIERFRLHFIPLLAARQPIPTVSFFEPRLAGLCETHAQYVGTFLASEARGTQSDPPNAEQFRLVFKAAPLALLALLTLSDGVRSPDPKRVFVRVIELLEQVDLALAPRQFVAGQLRNELDVGSRECLDTWVSTLLPVELPFEPWYCRVVKYGIPLVFTAASSVVGAAGGPGVVGGAALGIAAGTPAGFWLSEAINPHRRHNVAIRNFAAVQSHWQKLKAANNLSCLLRSKAKSQLGLELVGQ